MFGFRHIIMGLIAAVLLPQSASAQSLTRAEQNACASLRMCIDIVERHDASEFDYYVLTQEFRRFGPQGRAALFRVLGSEDGTADVASIIAALGSRRVEDQAQIDRIWRLDRADNFLPLLADGSLASRNMLLAILAHPDANIREKARVRLIPLSDLVKRQPVPPALRPVLLEAMMQDPISMTDNYIRSMPVNGLEDRFSSLLLSGDPYIVSAAYAALYRDNPAEAFNRLMIAIRNVETAEQARAIGSMLAERHESRADGFYAKFSSDLSADINLSPHARAVGLQASFQMGKPGVPALMDMTPARLEALEVLVMRAPFWTQDRYAPVLSAMKSQAGLDMIWTTAQIEHWINRDSLTKFYLDTPLRGKIMRDLIGSNDARSFQAGLRSVRSNEYETEIRAKINHPVQQIALSARSHLGLKPAKITKCGIPVFDLDDMSVQMPFFDDGWMRTLNHGRTTLDRKMLTTAHPTKTGWLAGYVLEGNFKQAGGGIIFYDNQSGGFKRVGDFKAPIAILPDHLLQLGETTNRFWVVDNWGGDSFDVSAYIVEIFETDTRVRHIGALPYGASEFGLNANGDLLMAFTDDGDTLGQAPLRLSAAGDISSACRTGS